MPLPGGQANATAATSTARSGSASSSAATGPRPAEIRAAFGYASAQHTGHGERLPLAELGAELEAKAWEHAEQRRSAELARRAELRSQVEDLRDVDRDGGGAILGSLDTEAGRTLNDARARLASPKVAAVTELRRAIDGARAKASWSAETWATWRRLGLVDGDPPDGAAQ